MIRPELARSLRRWREVLAGLAVIVLGGWLILGFHGILHLCGYGIVLAGIAICWAGWQRARFTRGGGGQGVVQVTEGRISYFGPFTGGTVALTELRRICLDPGAQPPCWRLAQIGQPDLCIPLDAEGTDALFDIFAALPGLRTSKLIAEVEKVVSGRATGPVTVWDRGQLRLH